MTLTQICMDGPGGKLLSPAIQVYKKWLNFEELYKISYLEIDLHILYLNLLGHGMTVVRENLGRLTTIKHLPTRNYMMSDDAIEYLLYEVSGDLVPTNSSSVCYL